MSYSDRFTTCFVWSVDIAKLNQIISDFASISGLTLTFPGKSSVSVLSELGEQFFVDIDTFKQEIMQLSLIRFQYWWNDSEDLYCIIRRDGRLISIEFALEGCTIDQEINVWECIKKIFVSLGGTSAPLMLILDRDGRTADYPWTDIVRGYTKPLIPYPDEIIVPTTSKYLIYLNPTFGQIVQFNTHFFSVRSIE